MTKVFYVYWFNLSCGVYMLLSCWQACLDSVSDTVQQNASRWWCHIYSLLMPYMSPSSVCVYFYYYNPIFSIFHPYKIFLPGKYLETWWCCQYDLL